MSKPNVKLAKKHLKNLVSFDTTNPPRKIERSGIIEYLKECLPEANISITDYGQGSINILAIKGNPNILFNYHIDTVPETDGWSTDPFHLEEKENKLYGLGACDIKGAAACLLACVECGISDYAVLFSSDEEHGSSLCVRSFLKEKHHFEGVIVAEPTQAKAVLAHRGIITATLSFEAESGHSSEPRALADNSNHQAVTWISNAIDWASHKLQDEYQGLKGTCFNVGRIEGGIKPNIIAPKTEVKFGLRTLPERSPHAVMNELIGATQLDESHVTINFKAPPLPANNQLEANQRLAEDLALDLSEPVNFWTEASLFSEAGFPVIVYGPGSIEQAHTANEWVDVEQLEQVLENYWRILGHE